MSQLTPSSIKRLGLSGLIIGGFALTVVRQAIQQPTDSVIPSTTSEPTPSQATSQPIEYLTEDDDVQVSRPSPSPVAKPSSQPKQSGYKNGSYTGLVADAYYGPIQVRATIAGGKLTDVTFLQYPNDREQSIEINTRAMPILRSEAIQAQSAQVDGVTGASDSSLAFVQSLGDALSKTR